MVRTVSIKNFKSIVDLNLDLGRLNVFIGENGSGKTNILEAIAFGSSSGSSSFLDITQLELRGVRIPEPKLLRAAFTIGEQKGNSLSSDDEVSSIALINPKGELMGVNIQEYSLSNNSWKFKRGFSNLGNEAKIFLEKHEASFKNSVDEFINFDTDAFIDTIFGEKTVSKFLNYSPENFFLRRFEEEGQVRPLGTRGEGLFTHLVNNPSIVTPIAEKLRLISWFDSFDVPKDLRFTEKRIDIKDKYLQDLGFFDQRSANEGFLYLLFYFTLFISPYTPHFFAIDNIDNALNPKLGAELIRQLAILTKDHDKQVILTTHNPAILDGLDLTDDEQRLFTIYRNADGHTIARRVKAPKKLEGIETVRLSEAFIRGYLGGLPQNF